MDKGSIIFLIGVSSAGKSTLAKLLQRKFAAPYFHLSKDMFMCEMAPEHFSRAAWPDKYAECTSLFIRTIRMFSDMGKNVIADSVRLDEGDARLLSDSPVVYAHVTCHSAEELRRRERMRGDRAIGQAERQLLEERPDMIYDVTLDTCDHAMVECAELLRAHLAQRIPR